MFQLFLVFVFLKLQIIVDILRFLSLFWLKTGKCRLWEPIYTLNTSLLSKPIPSPCRGNVPVNKQSLTMTASQTCMQELLLKLDFAESILPNKKLILEI